jgi:hypothetical protein
LQPGIGYALRVIHSSFALENKAACVIFQVAERTSELFKIIYIWRF